MRMLECDIFKTECDALCITTNGFVKANGQAVMGKGCARQASTIIPEITSALGAHLKTEGNRVHVLLEEGSRIWLSFPVKPHHVISDGSNFVSHMNFKVGAFVPGWAAKANLAIIFESCKQLMALIDERGWKKVLLPRPGCGAGELTWEAVRETIEPVLDDRIYICDFPRR